MSSQVKRWQVVSGTITRRAEGGKGRGARLGTRYKRGDVFEATEYEVRACRDQVRCLDPDGDGVRREEARISEPVSEHHGTEPAIGDGQRAEEDDGGDEDIEHEPAADGVANLEVVEAAPGWFDVINRDTGEKVNEKRLRKEQAQQLAAGG